MRQAAFQAAKTCSSEKRHEHVKLGCLLRFLAAVTTSYLLACVSSLMTTTVVASAVKFYIQKLVMTLMLIDMGLAGPVLQLWKLEK
jgi:hypothetical protein